MTAPEHPPQDHQPQDQIEAHTPYRRRLAIVGATILIIAGIAGCANAVNDHIDNTPSASVTSEAAIPANTLTNDQLRERTGQIISANENSTTTVQYGYAENIDDGRGVTAGIDGFTSGTGDLVMVVERYDELKPANNLETYLEPLRKIDKQTEDGTANDSTKNLEGFVAAWRADGNDSAMHQAQNEIHDKLYFNPALKRAKESGVVSAAGILALLDTIIQHGEGEDIDGLPAILKETTDKYGNSTPQTERSWIENFLKIRRQHLLHAHDPATRADWKESVDRTRALKSLLNQDPTLRGPLSWSVYGDKYTLPAIQ
jgi:chitosanase